jgi:hypothetical protein
LHTYEWFLGSRIPLCNDFLDRIAADACATPTIVLDTVDHIAISSLARISRVSIMPELVPITLEFLDPSTGDMQDIFVSKISMEATERAIF